MNNGDQDILATFKSLLKECVPLYAVVLFGSRARGDATPDSDMDVLIVLDAPISRTYRNAVLDCAWEAGYDAGIVITPVVVSRDNWENGPDHHSLLAKVIREEGYAV